MKKTINRMKQENESRETIINSPIKNSFLNRIKTFKDKKINSRYSLISELGCGGFGVVYMASDTVLEREVAIKFLDPDYTCNEKKFHRVKREINISRKITDKRVVKIFSLEKYEGIYFLVMEYLDGKSLKDKIREDGRIGWTEFSLVFINILKGVKALHDQEIIHRDLKPSNIMLVGDGEIKILDFGLSKEVDDLERTSSIGELIGSPHYMSPEQANMGEIGMRSDIYQVGLILYRVLSDSMPFDDSKSTFELIYKRILEKPKKIDRKKLNIPKYVEFGIFKAIERKVENRFNSIVDMISFFEKGNFSLTRKIFHNIKKFKWRIIFLSLLILTAIYIFLSLFGNREVSYVEFNQSNISAYNNLGIGLWEKDFKPYTINTSFILDNNIRVEADTNRNNFSIDTKKILTLLNNHSEIKNISIASRDLDNKVSILTNDGQELDKIGFYTFFDLGVYDFFKKFYASKIINTDVDRDGHKEKILFIRHFMDMFPTAFVFIKDSNIYSYANPGTISDYVFLKPAKGNVRILMCGVNNILSHLFFVAEINFPLKSNFLVRQTSIPNLRQRNIYLPEFLSFIPNFSSYDNSDWERSGLVKFKDYRSGNEIILTRDYKLTINDGKSVVSYSDDKDNLFRIYNQINQYYSEKLLGKNNKKAYEHILNCIDLAPQNPFLNSALLFFKADLEIEMGYLDAGKKSLKKSLEYYHYNMDAAQRLCEIDFLRGDPTGAFKRATFDLGYINKFWGISSGKEIFKSYCMLQAGKFSRAKEIISLSVFKSNLSNSRTFYGIIKLFSGDYEDSYKILSGIDENRILTVAESRLFAARAMMLSGKDLDKAEFYFNDIALNSSSLSHLAKISNHFLKLKNMRTEFRFNDVKRDFENLIKLSGGNFQARLWLFYDAFIYGKIMELMNNRNEALRGYEISVKSNPYTKIAVESGEKISELKSN